MFSEVLLFILFFEFQAFPIMFFSISSFSLSTKNLISGSNKRQELNLFMLYTFFCNCVLQHLMDVEDRCVQFPISNTRTVPGNSWVFLMFQLNLC